MLRGKVALVTGATSGLGLAIAKSMAKHGAHVAINGFGDVDKALHEIEASKGYQNAQIHYESADMRKVPEIEGMIRNIETKFSSPEVENGGDGIDILVNCAGIQHVSPIEDFPIEKWNDVIAINLTSAYHTTRLTLPYMKTKNWGRIINIASTHGLVGSAMKSAYVASKHGMVGLTKSIALETITTGITCNALCPGWVLTPLVEKQIEAKAKAEGITLVEAKAKLLLEKQPSGEFVKPEQLANLAVFLCGEDANQVRGVAWNVDGGWTAQ